MCNLTRFLLLFLSLATIFSAYPSQAAEDVYLKGNKGHFRLEPGKVYHWDWKGIKIAPKKTGLPEKIAVTGPPVKVTTPTEAAETAPAVDTSPSTANTVPKAVEADARMSEGVTPAITREAVAMMISELEDAANRKDIDGISYYLAPELVVLKTVDSSGGRQDLRLSKEEYLDKFRQEFSSPNYHYKSYNVEIIISQDGQSGIIVEDVRETVGANTEVRANQKAAIELRDGQIVVTKIVSIQK